MARLLTYREASKLVGRSRRTLRHWRLNGLPMTWGTRNGQTVRLVEITALRKYARERLRNDPIVQQRIRAEIARERGAQGPTRRETPAS